MTRVWDRLFVGSIRDAQQLAVSNPNGVTTVISLCEERVRTKNPSINYLRFPIDDSRLISKERFDAIIDAIAENIRWGTVLVHCIGGSSRTPIIAAAWMHVVGYKDIESALVEIGERRQIEPSPVLLNSIEEQL